MQAAGVQVYFAGHDHNLEHIHPPGGLPHYIISGGGSKCDRPFIGDADSLFQWQSSGRALLPPQQDLLPKAESQTCMCCGKFAAPIFGNQVSCMPCQSMQQVSPPRMGAVKTPVRFNTDRMACRLRIGHLPRSVPCRVCGCGAGVQRDGAGVHGL